MFTWLLVVMALSLFQIIGSYFFLPYQYIYLSNLLVLLSALGMVYRVWRKTREAHTETLQNEILELRKEIAELKK